MTKSFKLYCLIAGLSSVGHPLMAGEVSFNRDIRPIFLKNCTACHGGVKEAGGISFIYRERALREGESGKNAIVPGKPESSEMMRRIRSTDPDEMMPQPKHGTPLKPADIKLVETWISEGAKWEEHWAFMPPIEKKIPALKNESWTTQALDRFVLHSIEQNKLTPSPQASPAEWLRRVSFDLTGLPPTIDQLKELEAAWNADGKAAREKVVDHLLASPAYGERWATVWLDLARYADTFGFEKDPHRDIWPWKDWVIRSLNADMPYDQFTIEQMAGDLLPNATADQILATAFHRNTQTNTEGGTDDEEYRVAAVIDRISTVWTTWQATTFGCVQCHSHPYDPIAHEEFYEFMDFFNQSEDSDLKNEYPKIKLVGDEWVKLHRETRALREALDAEGRKISDTPWKILENISFAPQHGTMRMDQDGMIFSEGNLRSGTTHKISGHLPKIDALKISIYPQSDNPKNWPEIGAFVTLFHIDKISTDGKRTPVPMGEVIADHLSGSTDPMSAFAQKGIGARFQRFKDPTGRDGATSGLGEFPRIAGPRKFVILPESQITLQPGEFIEISLKQGANANESQTAYVRKFKIEVTEDARYTALRSNPKRIETWQKVFDNLDRMLALKGTEVPVMADRPAAGKRETRLFARGNRLTKEQVVKADVPDLLRGNFPKKEEANRLDMARWMVSTQNPLTARVMVNRLWGEMFGIGIVETMEDFGTSGTLPSNLALLDHLALRFQGEHKWSIKKALREITLSSTYLQTSKATPALLEIDPKNQLLARGPRNRLSAEMVRDQALATSGLLSKKMYGQPVYPPQPAGVWNSVYSGANWNESKGEDKYRRGLYTYVKRTSGFPGFLTFDAPSRDVCSARRIVSNTPLQALVTMNDPAHIEAAAALAEKMRQHSGEIDAQISFAYLTVTQHQAGPHIIKELVALYQDLKKETPEAKGSMGPDPALTLTANTILNLDAALT
ncbi:MAG: PSD1 and planctomycete cytochrome C domain-containing protein, partial [Akkermansiaceae bacterium]